MLHYAMHRISKCRAFAIVLMPYCLFIETYFKQKNGLKCDIRMLVMPFQPRSAKRRTPFSTGIYGHVMVRWICKEISLHIGRP